MKKITKKQAKAFVKEIIEVSKKHNLTLSFNYYEEFTINRYKRFHVQLLREAINTKNINQ